MGEKAAVKASENELKALSSRLKEAEKTIEDLKSAEKQSKSILDASPNPIVIYDIDGKVKYLNPAFTKTFGWTIEELERQ